MRVLAEYIRIKESDPKRIENFIDALGGSESHRLGRVTRMLNDLIDACGSCTALALVEAKQDPDDRLVDLRKAKVADHE